MKSSLHHAQDELGPWNPGIESIIPPRLLPLATIFRPENVFTSVERARELQDVTGLDLSELVVFRPERLVLHETLIRVTSDLSVPDGTKYEDLGINFRQMVDVILTRYVSHRMQKVTELYARLQGDVKVVVDEEIALAASPVKSEGASFRQNGLVRWFGLGRRTSRAQHGVGMLGLSLPEVADRWAKAAATEAEGLRKEVLNALAKAARAFYRRAGHSWPAPSLFSDIAVGLTCNAFCSDEIGRFIAQSLLEAAEAEGYRYLPSQAHPIVMNTKGPSASGKSTLRPLQRRFVGAIGARWEDFALISPDIWRKQLLNYSSLGSDYRYGAMLTGEEMAIIDDKLDHYMARSAERGRVPHLLIDRFRFGSFKVKSEEVLNNLLSRFGHKIYLCFMITPPEDIVERAWVRGLRHGRYKAVSDLLDHSVEAYTGMPRLFLAWAQRRDKWINYEFLDNSVSLGQRPRTIAFGSNGTLVVLDVRMMLNVERFRTINISATSPAELYSLNSIGPDLPQAYSGFLVQCVKQLPEVLFAEQETGRAYLHVKGRQVVWVDPDALALVQSNQAVSDALRRAVPDLDEETYPCVQEVQHVRDLLGSDQVATIGDWGNHAND